MADPTPNPKSRRIVRSLVVALLLLVLVLGLPLVLHAVGWITIGIVESARDSTGTHQEATSVEFPPGPRMSPAKLSLSVKAVEASRLWPRVVHGRTKEVGVAIYVLRNWTDGMSDRQMIVPDFSEGLGNSNVTYASRPPKRTCNVIIQLETRTGKRRMSEYKRLEGRLFKSISRRCEESHEVASVLDVSRALLDANGIVVGIGSGTEERNLHIQAVEGRAAVQGEIAERRRHPERRRWNVVGGYDDLMVYGDASRPHAATMDQAFKRVVAVFDPFCVRSPKACLGDVSPAHDSGNQIRGTATGRPVDVLIG